MPEPKPLVHVDAEKKDDATLRKEAEAHFLKNPALQVVAELILKLRARTFGWWAADDLRVWWNATERLRWLRQRPDLRAQITSSLTGLAHGAARKKSPELQGSLLDSFLEDGDITLRQFEEAFDAVDVVVYGPAMAVWKKFRERFPCDHDAPVHQDLVAFLLRAFLSEKSALRGATRAPLVSALDLRAAIPSGVWQTRIPADVRASIDDARLQRERAREPFLVAHELAIATPEIIAASIPLRDLLGVLDVAMGTEASMRPSRPREPIPDADAVLASIAKRASSSPPPATNAKAATGYLTLSSPSVSASVAHAMTPSIAHATKPKRSWPDDEEEDLPTIRPHDDDTQPRVQAIGR